MPPSRPRLGSRASLALWRVRRMALACTQEVAGPARSDCRASPRIHSDKRSVRRPPNVACASPIRAHVTTFRGRGARHVWAEFDQDAVLFSPFPYPVAFHDHRELKIAALTDCHRPRYADHLRWRIDDAASLELILV
eukprot:3638583-Prymnesium_polylepis.1